MDKSEEPSKLGSMKFRMVRNDSSRENLFLLTGIKTIFQRQLPKMPREYIARLVYDRNHHNLILLRDRMHIVGGITVKLFMDQGFGEIVFCAVSSSEQVKGYGSFMMGYLKQHAIDELGIKHFLTYADNYAIGYFKKMGFSRKITLDRHIWGGRIKDYEGGTLMECRLIEKINYRDTASLFRIQREAIHSRLERLTQSHIIRPGLEFRQGSYRAKEIPGVLEAGWKDSMRRDLRQSKHSIVYRQIYPILCDLQHHASAWPFLEPVDTDQVPDYLSVVKHPMDFQTIESKVERDQYQNVGEFCDDVVLIFDNCQLYNKESTNYYKCANILQVYFQERLKRSDFFNK